MSVIISNDLIFAKDKGEVIGVVAEDRLPFAAALPSVIAQYFMESWGVDFAVYGCGANQRQLPELYHPNDTGEGFKPSG